MPRDKPKVNSYLETDELAALDKFCRDNGLTRSKGVAHLIRNILIEDDESIEVKEVEGGYEDRLKRVEKANGSLHDFRFKQACINEKADRLIAELQEEVSRLKEKLKDKPVEILQMTKLRRLQDSLSGKYGCGDMESRSLEGKGLKLI